MSGWWAGKQPPALDFEALETAVRRQALRFAARVVEQRLNADHSDFTGASQPCACGRPARYVDRRAKPFQSVLGELRLERAYYYCAACQRGFCPRDQQFGMEGDLPVPGGNAHGRYGGSRRQLSRRQ